MATSEIVTASIEQFLDAIWLERGLSENTLSSYRRDLEGLDRWCRKSGIELEKISKDQLLSYLAVRLNKKLSARSTARFLSCIRGYFRYLIRELVIEIDPSENIESPKLGRPLPKTLTEQEVELILAMPNCEEPIELRDKAMLEVLYACGLRVTELVSLRVNEINLRQGVLRVTGKGGKERLVPLGEEAVYWLEQYLEKSRVVLLGTMMDSILFPSSRGKMMTRQTFWHRLKQYSLRAGINKELSPHIVRHAFATHLINNGADLRVVQMLLGHSDLSTTQIYTHVAQHRLQELHANHHPRG